MQPRFSISGLGGPQTLQIYQMFACPVCVCSTQKSPNNRINLFLHGEALILPPCSFIGLVPPQSASVSISALCFISSIPLQSGVMSLQKVPGPAVNECSSNNRDVFSGLCTQTPEPSARVPVCSCGAVNQTSPAKRERERRSKAPGQETTLENTPLPAENGVL